MNSGALIIGAGGHGKVIADIMRCLGRPILGFVDDNAAIIGQQVFGLPVLGRVDQWADFGPDGLIAGVGDNGIRRVIVERAGPSAPRWVTALHPASVIAASVGMGAGAVVMAGAIINADTIIGSHAIVNTGATIDHDCIIGDFVHVAPGAHLAGGVHVGDGALLGIGCAVTPGRRIGAGAVIGAGAAVVCDIPPGVIAKGVPARWDEQP